MFAFHLAWALIPAAKQAVKDDRRLLTLRDARGKLRTRREIANRLWLIVMQYNYDELYKYKG